MENGDKKCKTEGEKLHPRLLWRLKEWIRNINTLETSKSFFQFFWIFQTKALKKLSSFQDSVIFRAKRISAKRFEWSKIDFTVHWFRIFYIHFPLLLFFLAPLKHIVNLCIYKWCDKNMLANVWYFLQFVCAEALFSTPGVKNEEKRKGTKAKSPSLYVI
jgi:hypothetical protein